jgi:hypothetical protein
MLRHQSKSRERLIHPRFWLTCSLALALCATFELAAHARGSWSGHNSGGGYQAASATAKNSSKGTSGSWHVHIHPNMLGYAKPPGMFKPNKTRTDPYKNYNFR